MTAPFVQVNPFRKNSGAKKGETFRPDKHLRQFVAVHRLPILAIEPTSAPDRSQVWERTKKVEMIVSTRNKAIGRATFDDAVPLAYICSEATRMFNTHSSSCGFVELDPARMLAELGQPVDDAGIEAVKASLRRLVMTTVEVRNWGSQSIRQRDELLFVTPVDNASRFYVSLPEWLQDEIAAHRITRIPAETLAYRGVRGRLYGWAKGLVGQKLDGIRYIPQREALARIGMMAPGSNAWTIIAQAVVANDVPGYDFSLQIFKGQPAIAVREQVPFTPAPTNEMVLGWPAVPTEPPPPREVSIGDWSVDGQDRGDPIPTPPRSNWRRPISEPAPPMMEVTLEGDDFDASDEPDYPTEVSI
ncbi:MAG: hypothetical protein ABI395_05440 [Sphingobium sp.]